eukprot:Skav212329  [mRNA]  locus=scaffold3374:211386:217070:- [translate_table: standard]
MMRSLAALRRLPGGYTITVKWGGPLRAVQAARGRGCAGVPAEMGGVDLNFTAACLAIEEVAKVDPAAFKRYGSQELQERYLPRLAAGTPSDLLTTFNTVGAFCLSEPNSGSDAFALKSKAAGVFVVFANADPSKGHRGLELSQSCCSSSAPQLRAPGITAFVVDRDNKGLQIGKKERCSKNGVSWPSIMWVHQACPLWAFSSTIAAESKWVVYLRLEFRVPHSNPSDIKSLNGVSTALIRRAVTNLSTRSLHVVSASQEDKLGIRASSTCELVLEGCRVPKEAVLGEVGQGYKIAIELLNEGRIGIGAQMVGLAQGAFDYAMRYMASEVAQDVSSQCIDWLGGVGFTRELLGRRCRPYTFQMFLAEKYYRDAKIGTIYEGTSNIQLQTIGKGVRSLYSE